MARVARAPLLAAVAATGVLTASLWIANGEPAFAWAGTGRWAAFEAAVGVALVGIGLDTARRRPGSSFPLLVILVAAVWPLAEWGSPGAGSAVVFSIGLVAAFAAVPVVVLAAATYPDRNVGRLGGAAAGLAALATLGAVGLMPALFFDPEATGCSACPDNLFLVHADAGTATSIGRLGLTLGAVGVGLALILVMLDVVRASTARRRLVWPVIVPACAYLLLVTWQFAADRERGVITTAASDHRLWVAQGVALAGLAAGVGVGWLRARRRRNTVARIVAELASAPSPGDLSSALAADLGDPDLCIAYPVESEGGWADVEGQPVVVDPAVTRLVEGGETIAALVHRPGLLDDPTAVEAIVHAARLPLEHERLQSQTAAQTKELRRSRARIVAAADTERRRLERDLHDGAQQRLVAYSLTLRLRRQTAGPAEAAVLERAEEEVRETLAELRRLAHGIYPAALEEEGFAAAVNALAESADQPLRVTALPDEDIPAATAAAAYFVLAEATRLSTTPIRVGAHCRAGRLLVEIAEAQVDALDPVELEDRVGAVDGTIAFHGSTIVAEFPCA